MKTVSVVLQPARGICPDLSILRYYFTQGQIILLWHGRRQAEEDLAASRALVKRKDKALARVVDMLIDYVPSSKSAGQVSVVASAGLMLTEAKS